MCRLHSLFSFVLVTLKWVLVIVYPVDDMLHIHWTTLSGSYTKDFWIHFTYTNRSTKAEMIYEGGLSNCVNLYSSSQDHRVFIHYVIYTRYWF